MRFTPLRIHWFWLLSGGLMLGLAEFSPADESQNQPQPQQTEKTQTDLLSPFTVSKETTRITEPLKSDGTVDYAAALNARLREGLAPEDNAGTFLIKAFGYSEIPEAHRKKFFESLGAGQPNPLEGSFRNYGEFVESHLKSANPSELEQERQKSWDQQRQAMNQPWSRKELPIAADWVEANSESLALATKASKKSRLFIPIVVGENEPLLNQNTGFIIKMREVARLLRARAMLAIGEGRLADAQADLLACHRLAVLVGQQPTMVDALVSYAIDAIACEGDLVLAQSEKISPQELAAYRRELADLPPLAEMSVTVDRGERIFSLDAICNLATNVDEQTAKQLGFPNNKIWMRMLGLSIDWDVILKRFNQEYDKMVAALRHNNFATRQAELTKIETELKKLQAEINKPAQVALMLLGVDPPRAVVSRQIGNVLIGLLLPAVRQAHIAEVRAIMRRDLTILAFALAEHHREVGRYPEKLDALAPKYLKTIPKDRFTDKPLKYKQEKAGYVLYSVGGNGQDDKGQSVGQGNQADDLTVRVPSQPEL